MLGAELITDIGIGGGDNRLVATQGVEQEAAAGIVELAKDIVE